MRRIAASRVGACGGAALGLLVLACSMSGAELDLAPEPRAGVLSLPDAVVWGLQHNPELAALRAQHGIAAAGIVIANTYPFNPVWEAKVRATNGPESAGITNRVSNEHKVFVDVEIRHQGRYRRQIAQATLSRTDWEIAFQETALAVRVIRAFDTVLYREKKLDLVEQTVRLNEEAAALLRRFRAAGRQVTAADLLLIQTEVADARAQRGPGRGALATAGAELRRALGITQGTIVVQGTLARPLPLTDSADLTEAALAQRADLHARQAAVTAAASAIQLEIANRYGNPNLGPAYEYDPTRINLIGVQWTIPLPVFNQHEGEIRQRQAEHVRAQLDLRQTEQLVQQDVRAALVRLDAAAGWVKTYESELLPNLGKSLTAMEELFRQGEPGVDLLRILDVRRKLLHARDVYLDALWEVRQAAADLAAAVGDPSLAAPPAAESAPPVPATPVP
jgi:outer membrane protein TolC